MAAALAMTAIFATVAMAAVGADGLEYWDKDEIYFRDGMDFSMNISGQNVPEWLKNDIAGKGNTVNFKLRNYEVRYSGGMVNFGGLVELSGQNGAFIYPCEIGIGLPDGIGSSLYDERDLRKLYKETGASYFTGLSYAGDNRGSGHIMTSKLVANTYAAEKGLNIGSTSFDILFGFSENDELISVSLAFYTNVPKFYHLKADISSLKMINGIENRITDEWELAPAGRVFASFENNYKNINTDKAIVSLISADIEKIVLNTSFKFDGQYMVCADVYKGNKRIGSVRNENTDKLVITFDDEVNKGDKCRVDLYISDNKRIIYRWQDYITIP